MDALALLKKDHQTIDQLFARFEKKPSSERDGKSHGGRHQPRQPEMNA